MKAVTRLGLLGKFVLLSLIFFVVHMLTQAALGPKDIPAPPTDQMSAVFIGLILMALVDTGVFMLLALRSRWTGWRLVLGLVFALIGVIGVMPQSEAWWFGESLGIRPATVLSMLVQTVVTVVIFAPLAVWILGAFQRQGEAVPSDRLEMPIGQWAWRLAVIAGAYLALYFGFGAMIAWQNPNLVAMYDAASHPQLFAAQRLIPFQVARALAWTLFTLPVIRMLKGGRWETAILVGLLLALPMNIGHTIPNSFMPDASVRLSHFIETTSSNFIFGLLITWLLIGWGKVESKVSARVQVA
jgi:hypothetical protein